MTGQIAQLVNSPGVLRDLSELGYHVIRGGIPVRQLNAAQELMDSTRSEFDTERFSWIHHKEARVESRTASFEMFGNVTSSLAEQLLIDCVPYYGTLAVKPPSGEKSRLGLHQDQTMIPLDVGRGSVTFWVPLVQVTRDNGCVCVWPGSHRLNPNVQAQGMPFAYHKYSNAIWPQLMEIRMHAGDVLLMDQSLIHASLPNMTSEMRPVITGMYRGNEAEVHCYELFSILGGGSAAPRTLGLRDYLVDDDFYTTCLPENVALEGRPLAEFPLRVRRLPEEMENKFRAMSV